MKNTFRRCRSLPIFATILLSAGLLLMASQASAETKARFSLGAKLDFSNWEGENPGGADFDEKSTMLGVEAKVQHGKWFGGLTLAGGEFEFDSPAPSRPTPLPASNETTIKRTEVDLILGYRFWPRIALFLDLKNVTNEWDADDYKIEYTGLGFGIAGHYPLDPKWTLFGNFGVVPMNIEADGDDVGDATRTVLNVGFLYRIKQNLNFSIGLQSQNQTDDYDDGGEQDHRVGALTLGINVAL